ncbi:nitroreductase family protein [Sulfobacillus thermosulfidooxidans]|uniref:nitroreductase family protein n=1 Tax=Sulfobacillus thermosulfidooxidans TaxID=28034 RepID=UPI0002E649D6|nr:nitroreductase [Sulfobacillus thermosulfidooxidans]
MDLYEGLISRRTIHRFRTDPVPDDIIRLMLSAAIQAPNHHLTQPWRFVVIRGQSLQELANYRYEVALDKAQRQNRPHAERIAEQVRKEFAMLSVVIAVIQVLADDPYRQQEDYAAVSCATYAMMLAAWSQGVGTYWGTGAITRYPPVLKLCQVADNERIIALVRVGYPEEIPHVPRIAAEDKTLWLT